MNQDTTNNPSAENHSTGKKTQSRKKLLIFGIAGIAIVLFCIFGLGLFSKPKVVQIIKSYGNMHNEVTFDKNNISEEEVDYLADGLTKTNFFDNAVTKYVYIKKIHGTVELSISSNPLITGNSEAMNAFVKLREDMQKQFSKNKIVINLVVYKFDNVLKRIE